MPPDYKRLMKDMTIHKYESPPSTGQREDGSWYWLDETGNYGDDVRHQTQAAAQEALSRYCDWLMGDG